MESESSLLLLNYVNCRRVCIVCGKLTPIAESVLYPKGKQRRAEFTSALKLPAHVAEALPNGCFICGEHFKSVDIETSDGVGPAQISEFAVPCLVSCLRTCGFCYLESQSRVPQHFTQIATNRAGTSIGYKSR
jgi:hypothetical protein